MRRLSVGRRTTTLALCAGMIAAVVPGGAAYADDVPAGADTTLVSVSLDGTSLGWSGDPSISADGRYVAFTSTAQNLVTGDTNGKADVFVRDRKAGVTTRVSVAWAGVQANGTSGSPSISADGRYVAFVSDATNLVPGDTNNFQDVFVHDLETGVTNRVSFGPLSRQANSASFSPAISADGRFVTYESLAGNLVDDDTNNTYDIFEYDRQTSATVRVSVASNGAQADWWSGQPSISDDGRYVAFDSDASNLATVPDTNGFGDIFVHDKLTGRTDRVNVGAQGAQGNAHSRSARISGDGRYVAFQSCASNLVPGDTNDNCDNFLVDRQTSAITRLNLLPSGEEDRAGAAQNTRPSISRDGRYTAFESGEWNLVPHDNNGAWDVFVRDRDTATTIRASVAGDGTEADSSSVTPSISADGKHVAFASQASNLAPDRDPWHTNVYVRDFAG